MEKAALRLAEVELESCGAAAKGLRGPADPVLRCHPGDAADQVRRLVELYDEAQACLARGDREAAIALLYRFVGDWLCGLGARSLELAKEARRAGGQCLLVALGQLLSLRQHLLLDWARQEPLIALDEPSEEQRCRQLYTRWSLARLRLNLWEGAKAPMEAALDDLCRCLLANHKARHGKDAGVKVTTLSLTVASMAAVSTGVSGLVAAGPAIAAVAIALGVSNLVSNARLDRARSKAKAVSQSSLIQLGLLTPAILSQVEELAEELLAEWADIRLSPEARKVAAASWRYDWWAPFAEAAEARWGSVISGTGLAQGPAFPSFHSILESSNRFVTDVMKMSSDTGKFMKPSDYEGSAPDGGTLAGFEASYVISKAFGAALGVFDVFKSVKEMRGRDPESAALLGRVPELRRLQDYASAVLDAYQAKLDGTSHGKERRLAAKIVQAKFRCSRCALVGPPLPCLGCGLWLDCVHCIAEDRPHVPHLCTGKGGRSGNKSHLWEAEMELLKTELHLPLSPLTQSVLRQLSVEGEPGDSLSMWKGAIEESLQRQEEAPPALAVAMVEQRFIQPAPRLQCADGRRRLLRQGILRKLCRRGGQAKPRHFFLFNDLLLYGKPLLGSLEAPRLMPLSTVLLKEWEDSDDFQNSWALATPGKTFAVSASSEDDKAAWLELLAPLCEGSDEAAAPLWTRERDCPECQLCDARFGLRTRRHHCRSCGRLVCGSCSPHRLAGQRACFQCRADYASAQSPQRSRASSASDQQPRAEADGTLVEVADGAQSTADAEGRPLVEAEPEARAEPEPVPLMDLPVPPLPRPIPSSTMNLVSDVVFLD